MSSKNKDSAGANNYSSAITEAQSIVEAAKQRAEKLLVTGGNVTYVMDRLEDQGLVYRYRRPDDRRVIQARLTEEGRDLVAEVFPGHASYMEHLSRHLSDDEQKAMGDLLKTLGTSIQEKDL